MDAAHLQQQLFGVIKIRLAQNTPVAEEVAKVLGISTDSAYRRMRGEKSISFDELYTLSSHFRVSLDQLMSIQAGGFVFQGQLIESNQFRFAEYMTNMMHTIAYYNSCREKEIYYICKDFPIFHHYQFREIAAFKYYFWMKTLLYSPEFSRRQFSFDEYPDELFTLGQKILSIYNQVPSYEVWNVESMSIMLHQIEYYREAQMFRSDEDALILYEAVEKLITHLERQAAAGYKYNYDDPKQTPLGAFHMYFNEVLLGDNNLLVVTDGVKTSMISHNVFNYMMTRDQAFNEYTYNYIQNLMKRSTLISAVSEKERNRLFRVFRERVARRKNALKV